MKTKGIFVVLLVLTVAVLPLNVSTAEKTWSIETVDSSGDLGWSSSLALDSAGNPHISYQEYAMKDLKYAELEETGGVLALERVMNWDWSSLGSTEVLSVARGDVDGDGDVEVVTGGYYHGDSYLEIAQLCVWDGATLAVENVQTWYWTNDTKINSVTAGDVDDDGDVEIVTGGHYYDNTRYVAQLCVWDGATLAVENVRTWYWTSDTLISSVAVGDVDGDGKMEIVTGGYYDDGTQDVAQLVVWDGATLTLENARTWLWGTGGYSVINSVAVGDVDNDGGVEIITGGSYSAGSGTNWISLAQLCVWSGETLTVENVRTWYWSSTTYLYSVALGDVDGDTQLEIVTGGHFWDSLGIDTWTAQLCVWDGSTLALENVQTWYWVRQTFIKSVSVGDVDGDGKAEVVTGGYFWDDSIWNAQLCVWSGKTLAVESVQAWERAFVRSVDVGDVDGDGEAEIVTGGDTYYSGAQLCVWSAY